MTENKIFLTLFFLSWRKTKILSAKILNISSPTLKMCIGLNTKKNQVLSKEKNKEVRNEGNTPL